MEHKTASIPPTKDRKHVAIGQRMDFDMFTNLIGAPSIACPLYTAALVLTASPFAATPPRVLFVVFGFYSPNQAILTIRTRK